MHIRQLCKQMSYSTEVLFLDYKLPNFVVKMPIVIGLESYVRDMVFPCKFFCQYELSCIWLGQLSPDIGCGFYNQI